MRHLLDNLSLIFLVISLPIGWWGGRWLPLARRGIAILEFDDRRLVLRHGLRTIVLDKRYRSVKCRDKVLTLFDRIQHVEIRHQRGQRSEPRNDSWFISLRISPLSIVRIGVSADEAEASIVGARLATVTGKPVLAL